MSDSRVTTESAPFTFAESQVQVEVTRRRQTQTEGSAFQSVLNVGKAVLMTGTNVVARVIGLPDLGAPIVQSPAFQGLAVGARTGMTAPPPPPPPDPNAPAGSTGGWQPAPAATPPSDTATAVASTVGAAAVGGIGPGSELATMQAMQRESQMFNMQLLDLQEQVQQENRRFTTLSNVLRAKHDTAKGAVSNIRS